MLLKYICKGEKMELDCEDVLGIIRCVIEELVELESPCAPGGELGESEKVSYNQDLTNDNRKRRSNEIV